MTTIPTRFGFGDTLQENSDATGVTVSQVVKVLREKQCEWDMVNL